MWGRSGAALQPFPISSIASEGAGSENESVEHISKEILCAQHSFGPRGPSLQDVVEAKTLAVIKEGFPGLRDEQEHAVLKKVSLCAFGV